MIDWVRFLRVWLWGPIALVLAFGPLMLCHALQIPTLLVLPFSRPLFRRMNTALAGTVWAYWALGLQKIDGTKVEIEGDPLPHREDAIVITNHQEMADIVVLAALATKAGSVRHLKWLVKDIIKYVPGIGWGLMFLDSVYLKREWARDEHTVRRVFARIADNHLPVWLSSFPEGTRATPVKLKKSQDQARSQGVEPLKYLLMPKSKGFVASVQSLRHHVKAVYSVTIGYVGNVPSLAGFIRGDCRRVLIHVRRFPIYELPMDDTDLAQWLREEFRRKDQVMARFVTTEGCGTAAHKA